MNKRIMILTGIVMVLSTTIHSQESNKYIYFKTKDKNITDICFSKNSEELAIPDGTEIKVFSTVDYKLKREFIGGHNNKILALKISNDGKVLVSGGKDSSIVIWDYESRQIIDKTYFNKGLITALDISSDSRYIASASENGQVIIYDLKEKKKVSEFNINSKIITSVKFSPDGKVLAAANEDNSIYLYDLDKGIEILKLTKHKDAVRDISFSKNGQKLISCGDDSRTIIWDIRDIGNAKTENINHPCSDWILTVDGYNDNETYALGTVNGNIKIITALGTFDCSIGVPVNKIQFKPSDDIFLILAVATRGKGVILIDAKDMIQK